MEATCKLGSKGCWNDGKCRATSNCAEKIITNADRIRSMSDVELAKYLLSISTAECPFDWDCKVSTCLECWNNWLERPAEEE